MWVELDLYDGLGWVEFFFTYHGGLGKKIPLTLLMHTPTSTNYNSPHGRVVAFVVPFYVVLDLF